MSVMPFTRRIAEAASFGSGRGPSKLRALYGDGYSVFHDTFEDGSPGHWRDHYTGSEISADARPYSPIGVARYPGSGGRYALWVSTLDRPSSVSGGSSGDSVITSYSTYRNMGTYVDPREIDLIVFTAWWTTLQTGSQIPGMHPSFGIDNQTWRSQDRSFYKANCRYHPYAEWAVTNNVASGGVNRYLGTDAVNGDGLSKDCVLGINQNKHNMNFFEMAVQPNWNETVTGYPRGRYFSLQSNQKFFDLTDSAVWSLGSSESGRQSVQGAPDPSTSNDHMLDYGGGLNFGFFGGVFSNTAGSCVFICGEALATFYPKGTVPSAVLARTNP